MGKGLIILVGIALVAVLVISIISGINSGNQTERYSAQQQTEQIMLQEYQQTQRMQLLEQTKQEAQQLRAEQTNNALTMLGLILGTVIGLVLLFVGIVFVNDRLERNRMNAYSQMERMERLRIQEIRMLELQNYNPKQISSWGLKGNYDDSQEEPKMVVYQDWKG